MNKVKLQVLGLSYSMSTSGAYALILSDETGLKRIPIVIGMSEAQSIAIQLEQIHPQRPLPHDLIKKLADLKKITLTEVFIYRLDAGVFYSELYFEDGQDLIKLDSRTSDAIALALRYDCPIYTTPAILERAAILVHEEDKKMEVSATEEQQTYTPNYSIAELQRLLQQAVELEEYEKASKIKELLDKKKQD